MLYTGLVKRIIPFLLTFAAGLFIASFFVSIALPNLNMRSERRVQKWHEREQLRAENAELREKIRALRNQNEELRQAARDWDEAAILEAVPPVELEAPHPPAPPRIRGIGTGHGSGSGTGTGVR